MKKKVIAVCLMLFVGFCAFAKQHTEMIINPPDYSSDLSNARLQIKIDNLIEKGYHIDQVITLPSSSSLYNYLIIYSDDE